MTLKRYNKILGHCYEAGEKFGVRGVTKSGKYDYKRLRAYFNQVIRKFSYLDECEQDDFFVEGFMHGFQEKVHSLLESKNV
jgi:hypothetical protein